jgi:hypothetical protein
MTVNLLLVTDKEMEKWSEGGFPARTLRSDADLREAFHEPAQSRRPVVWIAHHASQLSPLADQVPLLRPNHRLLLLGETKGVERDLLQVIFRIVVAPGTGMHIFPVEELKEVLAAPHRDELFVGGVVDHANRLVVLFRGTLEPVVVGFGWFERRNPTPKPDFADFEVTDYGQTVRLGEYEATADVILYMHDPEYRRRAKERELRHDPSFGAALRRLRLLRAVRRDDFPGISEKQIARIERGESTRPHPRTLTAIATRLRVEPAEIETY